MRIFKGSPVSSKACNRSRFSKLNSRVHETLAEVPLQTVLDSLRIVIEPDWREVDGVIRLCLPQKPPTGLANPCEPLQPFLNLVRNSFRAVRDRSIKELRVIVSARKPRAMIRF